MAGFNLARLKSTFHLLLNRITLLRRRPHNVRGQYQLRKFVWRSLLTLIGPLLVVGFYAYICFAILEQTAQNDIVSTIHMNARATFYLWFILSVFVLDWARTGLANIEAAALMHPRLAPSTATQLMWHADSKWANPLWWLRAIKSAVERAAQRRKATIYNGPGGPGYLWIFLSCTHLLLFVSLPLSGLTMEFSTVQTYSDVQALILGPNETTFNRRGVMDFSSQIRNFWQSGRPTAPRAGSVIYGPQGTENLNSSSYFFYEQAVLNANSIQFFMAPTVTEPVYGKTWGVHSNISCMPVGKDQLQTLRIDGIGSQNFSVNACILKDSSTPCQPQWYTNMSQIDSRNPSQPITVPIWLNESGASDGKTIYNIFAAADGFYDGRSTASPYTIDSNHDTLTFDHIVGGRSQDEVTTAIFEIFLWQMHFYDDDVMNELVNGTNKDPVDIVEYLGQHYAGIAVHCDVTSSVGYAQVDPASITYSSFVRSKSDHEPQIPPGIGNVVTYGATDIQPPQILAVQALAKERKSNAQFGPLVPVNYPDSGTFGTQTWITLHDAINSLPILRDPASHDWRSYHSLTPKNLTLAAYKLLGESVIAMMDGGNIDPSYGDLYTLQSATYLVPGVVSWIYVLTILCLWASILCIGAVWMLFFAGKRWAKTLDGLEMFKFGAQLADEVGEFEEVELKGTRNALKGVPGMVGMLPGSQTGGVPLGFIGLSENVASQEAHYTLDRRQASSVRPR